jgi:hypothetical protein
MGNKQVSPSLSNTDEIFDKFQKSILALTFENDEILKCNLHTQLIVKLALTLCEAGNLTKFIVILYINYVLL